jgi:hypothetical protein
LARQNFSHNKRQRELAKKQKREAKLQRKTEKRPDGSDMPENPEGTEGAANSEQPQKGPEAS